MMIHPTANCAVLNIYKKRVVNDEMFSGKWRGVFFFSLCALVSQTYWFEIVIWNFLLEKSRFKQTKNKCDIVSQKILTFFLRGTSARRQKAPLRHFPENISFMMNHTTGHVQFLTKI